MGPRVSGLYYVPVVVDLTDRVPVGALSSARHTLPRARPADLSSFGLLWYKPLYLPTFPLSLSFFLLPPPLLSIFSPLPFSSFFPLYLSSLTFLFLLLFYGNDDSE